MIYIDDIKELEKIIRNVLIEQSEISSKFVRNALSVYGTDLDQNTGDNIFTAIARTQALMLFELNAKNLSSDMSETNADDSISYYKAYTVRIIIYGDKSPTIANKLIARMRTQYVRDSLQDKGVYLDSVSNADSIYEYKNGVMWIRNDFSIDIACTMNIQPVTSISDFATIPQPIIYTTNKEV